MDSNVGSIPPEIYWNFVREFQPEEDRALICKRCTTRYYGGERCPIAKDAIPFPELDEERCFPGCYAEDRCLPRIVGVAGEYSFNIAFDEKYEESMAVSAEEMETRLIEVRSAWDAHVSTLGSPSRRLREALRIRRSFQLARACPLLIFPGCTVDDVIGFHVRTGGKKTALEGSVDPEIRPDTQLGFWVHEFIKSLAEDDRAGLRNHGSSVTFFLRDVLAALFIAGSDVQPFFDPLQELHDCPLEMANRLFKPGMSFDHVLTMVSIYQSRDDDDDAMQGLCWLLQGLGQEYSKIRPPRFSRGTWVECNLGGDHWHVGVVTNLWCDRFPYEVKLTCGSRVHAPFDDDKIIKKGTQRPLRFKEGDRVLCLMDDGWKRGVIVKFWEHGFPYWVRIENESDESESFAGVPFDLDDVVQKDTDVPDEDSSIDRDKCFDGSECANEDESSNEDDSSEAI